MNSITVTIILLAIGNSSLPASSQAPYLVIAGTAQDGGLPQIGCHGPNCSKARDQPGFRRLVASLLIVDPRDGRRWIVDTTPDLKEQISLFADHPRTRTGSGARPNLVDGIFLTHAHMGHYTGLLHLGREAYNHSKIPLYGSKRMCDFLKKNGPWDLLVKNGNIELQPLQPDRSVRLAEGLTVKPFTVPHRDEYSDTFGFVIEGPNKSVLYIPDIDKWERWERKIEDVIATVDVALLDGTFFADGEIPGRAMAEIPHPFIAESLKRFSRLSAAERRKIHFIHLNHSNPACDPKSEASSTIRKAGMVVASDGAIMAL